MASDRTGVSTLLSIGLGVVCGLAGLAHGQGALGDGRALERDMTRYGPGGPPPLGRDIMQEIRFRNAIVTGNAPGGLSFRGDLGYTDPFEFRGDLGSDDLFEFRRDSMFSGLAGVGIRGTEALQYQFALTTGSRVPSGLVGDLTYRRSGPGLGGMPGAPGMTGDGFLTRDRFSDPSDAAWGTSGRLLEMRSSASYSANIGLRDALMGVYPGQNGMELGVIASPLRGMRTLPLSGIDPLTGAVLPTTTFGADGLPTTPERDRPAAGARQPGSLDPVQRDPAAQFDPAQFDPARAVPGIPGAEPGTGRLETMHDQVMSRLRGSWPTQTDRDRDPRAATPPTPTLEERLLELRSSLRRAELPPTPPSRPGVEEDPEAAPVDPDEQVAPEDAELEDELARVLREMEAMDSLIPTGDTSRDMYAEHMAAAGRLMAAGRFFDAEARYVTALAVRPEDASAMVGRVHAQLGAGLLDSAAVNLRALLARHPELAGVRYSGDARPGDGRMRQVITMLRQRADGASGVRTGPALLLAYAGHQIGDRVVVREGLALLERSERERGQEGRDPMVRFVRSVWLGERSDEDGK